MKISVVDGTKLSKYVDSVSIDQFNVNTLLKTINSGKNKYDINSITEYLVSFVYNKLDNKTGISNNKLEKYLYAINKIFDAYNTTKVYLGYEIIIKAKSLEEKYINNRNVTGKEGEAILIDYFEALKKIISFNQKFKTQSNNDIKENTSKNVIEDEKSIQQDSDNSRISKLLNKIDILEKELDDYKKAISISSKQNNSDAKEINKLNQKINRLKEDVSELKSNLKKMTLEKEKVERALNKANDKSDKNNRTIDELALKIKNFESIIADFETQNFSLNEKITNYTKLNSILQAQLEQKEDELITLNSKIEYLTNDQNILDDFVLDLLFKQKMSLDEIACCLHKNNFDVSKNDILVSLKRINQKINVMPVVGIEKKYGIVTPAIRTNQKLSIPNNGHTLDIMLLADHHYLGEENEEYIKVKLDSVYDYCSENSINIVCSLGDMFDNKNVISGISKETYDEARKMIERFDKVLPFDINIKNLLLGGNHDRSFLKYGIDPIEELAFYRDDTISLGYNDAYLIFGGSDIVGLHHEGVPREDKVPNLKVSNDFTINNLKKSYDNAKLNYNEKYFDFLGHFHSGRFNPIASYGVVPSLNVDRYTDGAWHVKFYLDGSGKIDYMIIKPLIFGKEKVLRQTIEIPYQKIRK